jgi:hypothetical protein
MRKFNYKIEPSQGKSFPRSKKIKCLCLMIGVFFLKLTNSSYAESLEKDFSTPSNSNSFQIVENGIPAATIVIGENAGEVELFAASELQKYIKQISGAYLPISKANKKISGNLILLGTKSNIVKMGNFSKEMQNLIQTKNSFFPEDSFLIKTKGNNLLLAGNNPRSALYSVYALLETLGCRWFHSNDDVIPQEKTICLGQINKTEKPDFNYRSRWNTYSGLMDWLSKLRFNAVMEMAPSNTPKKYKNVPNYPTKTWSEITYKKLHKRGFLTIFGNHSFEFFLSAKKYFDKHPEYYSLIEKKRRPTGGGWQAGGQYCWSNPKVIEEVSQNIINFLKERPDIDIIDLWTEDTPNFCQCSKCKLLDTGKMSILRPFTEWDKSRAYLIFLNKVAEKVYNVYPDKKFSYLGYLWAANPPSDIKPFKTIFPELFTIFRSANRAIYEKCAKTNNESHLENQKYNALIKDWLKVSPNTVVGEYHYGAGAYLGLIFPIQHRLSKDYQYFKKIGVQGINTTHTSHSNEVTLYIFSKLTWDVNINLEKLLDDYCDKYYQEARKPMRKYWNILHNQMEKVEGDFYPDHKQITKLFDRKSIESLKKCIEEAKETAKNNKKVLARLNKAEIDFNHTYFMTKAAICKDEANALLRKNEYTQAIEKLNNGIASYKEALKSPWSKRWLYSITYMIDELKSKIREIELAAILGKKKNLKITSKKNIAQNPSAEKIKKETVEQIKGKNKLITEDKPICWGVYQGAGSIKWGSSTDEAHSGKRSAFLEALDYSDSKKTGQKLLDIGILQGNSDGYKGEKAYTALPNTEYFFSFWIKIKANVDIGAYDVRKILQIKTIPLCWSTLEATENKRQVLQKYCIKVTPTTKWTQYQGIFKTLSDTKKFALQFLVSNKSGNYPLGIKVYIDDVYIAPYDPQNTDKKMKTAIYNANLDGGKSSGTMAIMQTLMDTGKFQPVFISDLSPENLSKYKCLIFGKVNQMGSSQKNKPWVKNLREYVKKGGSVYFHHSSCGYKPHGWPLGDTTVFPEICKGVKQKFGSKGTVDELSVSAQTPLTEGYKTGDKSINSYFDHMALILGKNGLTLVTDSNKNPVAIVGKFGEGKVLFDGTIPYDAKTGAELEIMQGIQKDLLLNFINWNINKENDK